ncbi:MAG: hypothetical protein ACRD0K_16285 [Egibacteraceae bacterium]
MAVGWRELDGGGLAWAGWRWAGVGRMAVGWRGPDGGGLAWAGWRWAGVSRMAVGWREPDGGEPGVSRTAVSLA